MDNGTGARNGNGVLYSYVVPSGGYAPNGDIIAHSDSVTGDFGMIYDDLDRMIVAKAVSNVTAQSNYPGYFNCFAYDAYGNRLSEAMSITGCQSNPPKDSWANYYANNNQMSSNSMGTVSYDASGNMLKDGRNQYWYDAEGRVCASQVLNGGSAYQYVYDAEGARIAIGALSSVPSPATATCAQPFGSSYTPKFHYLVDQSGDQVTELDNNDYFTHSNIWIAGGLEATYDKTARHFNFEDPVGTKRAQANVLGQLDETCVSLPFGNDTGDNYAFNCTQHSNGLNTQDDDTEHHFSQKERDAQETGNDYFLARYYNSAWGRFITPDWSVKVSPVPYAAFTDPQSLNLYAYVRNSPLTRIDRDGHLDCAGKNASGIGCRFQAAWNSVHQIREDISKVIQSGKVTGELGFGLKGSVSVGPVKAGLGASLHDEKTYTDKDRTVKDLFTGGSPITDKLEGDAGLKLGPIGGSVEGGFVHTGGDDAPIERYGPKPEGTAEEQGLGEFSANEEELTFAVKGYWIIGGGITYSVDQKALIDVVKDIPDAAESLRKVLSSQ